jgi:hypothetical protein
MIDKIGGVFLAAAAQLCISGEQKNLYASNKFAELDIHNWVAVNKTAWEGTDAGMEDHAYHHPVAHLVLARLC